MTTQAAVQTLELPTIGYPMVTRMISHALFPETDGKEIPVTWAVSQSHPLVPDMKIVRMFVGRGGVEVYSIHADGKAAMRNLIPMHWVRLVEEGMPLPVFIEELEAAESDEPEPDDTDEPDEPEVPAPGPAPAAQ